MRERNTYLGNSTPPWHKPIDSSAGPVSHHGSFNPVLLAQDSGSHVLEIVQSSRQKARTMVDVAVQVCIQFKFLLLTAKSRIMSLNKQFHSNIKPSSHSSGVCYMNPVIPVGSLSIHFVKI